MGKCKLMLLRNARPICFGLMSFTMLAFVGLASGLVGSRGSWITSAVVAGLLLMLLKVWTSMVRKQVIRERPFPAFLKRQLCEQYPDLQHKDAELVERGLRQFFMASLRSGDFVAMPSRAVDTLWHAFILHTRAYEDWCQLAMGKFLHHTPAEALGADTKRNDGLRRVWYWTCKEESINPRCPSRLPLLFALDAKLKIPGGFHYQPDCRDIGQRSDAGGDGSGSYCGTSFSEGSFSGDADGFGGADGGGADGGDGGGGGGGD